MVVADPDVRQPDDLFFTADLSLLPERVASVYAGRWSIEDTFRNTKQLLGGEDPSVLARPGPGAGHALARGLLDRLAVVRRLPRRISALAASTLAPGQRTPSFADALAALRRALWARRLFDGFDARSQLAKVPDALIDALAGRRSQFAWQSCRPSTNPAGFAGGTSQ